MIFSKFWVGSNDLVWEVYHDSAGGLHLGGEVKNSGWYDYGYEYVTTAMRTAALEAAQSADPYIASEKVEVKHFAYSHGTFALRVDENKIHLVTVDGRSPTPSTFLKAFQMMELAPAVTKAAAERAYPYAVEVKSNGKTEFVVHEHRAPTVFFYPVTGRITINEDGEVEDFVLCIEDFVPVINAMRRAGILLDQPASVEEIDFWLPDGTEWRNPDEENLDGIF